MSVDPYGRGATTDSEPRCWRCRRLLARHVSRPWRVDCPRCKAVNQDGAAGPLVPNPGGD